MLYLEKYKTEIEIRMPTVIILPTTGTGRKEDKKSIVVEKFFFRGKYLYTKKYTDFEYFMWKFKVRI